MEKILDKRTQKGGYTEYLVKWRNYEVNLGKIRLSLSQFFKIQQDPEENTWEPLDNLGEAEKAIKLFEKEQVYTMKILAHELKDCDVNVILTGTEGSCCSQSTGSE